jgi:hypothetical protein
MEIAAKKLGSAMLARVTVGRDMRRNDDPFVIPQPDI